MLCHLALSKSHPYTDPYPAYAAQLLSIIRQHKAAAYLAGHDHSMALALDANMTFAKDKTAYVVSGAGGSCTLDRQVGGGIKAAICLISGAIGAQPSVVAL